MTKEKHGYVGFRVWLLVTIGCIVVGVYLFFASRVQTSLIDDGVIVNPAIPIFSLFGGFYFLNASALSILSSQLTNGWEMGWIWLSFPKLGEFESNTFGWGTGFSWVEGISLVETSMEWGFRSCVVEESQLYFLIIWWSTREPSHLNELRWCFLSLMFPLG